MRWDLELLNPLAECHVVSPATRGTRLILTEDTPSHTQMNFPNRLAPLVRMTSFSCARQLASYCLDLLFDPSPRRPALPRSPRDGSRYETDCPLPALGHYFRPVCEKRGLASIQYLHSQSDEVFAKLYIMWANWPAYTHVRSCM